jgi:hypothetical protein
VLKRASRKACGRGHPGTGFDPPASVVMNTVAGLRVMTRAYDAATLCRIADTPLTLLGSA